MRYFQKSQVAFLFWVQWKLLKSSKFLERSLVKHILSKLSDIWFGRKVFMKIKISCGHPFVKHFKENCSFEALITNYYEESQLLTCQSSASHMNQGCVEFSVNPKLVHDTILVLFKVIPPILFVCFCN